MALTTVDPLLLSTQAQYTGFKNRIINGNMAVWQRGTSTTTTAAGYYTADRWASYYPSGSGTISQDAINVPSGFQYGLKITSAASSSVCNFYQTIETNNCIDLAGQTTTLSVFACGTASTTASIKVLYSATTDAAFTSTFILVSTQTISLSATPTKFTLTAAIPSNAKTIQIVVASSGLNSGQFLSFTGVQLEKGTQATSFDYRPYGTELALCQRYYETGFSKLYVPPATTISIASSFKVQKRAAPTQSYSNSPGGMTTALPTANEAITVDGFCVLRSGAEIAFSWQSSAEL